MTRGTRTHRRARWAGIAALASLLGACRDTLPQSTLNPAGPQAEQINDLFFPVFWIAAGVFVFVEGAIVFAAFRYRASKARDANPVQTHGNAKLEVLWTVIPTIILAVITVPTIGTIFDLAREPVGDDVVHVRVVGHQWWWEFQYEDLGVVTANELHIPVDRPVYLTLTSAEPPLSGSDINAIPVIHSLWVPRLGGKQDVIPGRENYMTLEASQPGEYLGQCAEFCGLSHSLMQFRVIAEDDGAFDDWVAKMKAPAATPPPGSLEEEGFELFSGGTCIGCHVINGVEGQGRVGPDLSRFGLRTTLGAGSFENTPAELARWLDDPRKMKPGVVMPDYDLTEDQIKALVAYLRSLK